jgi:outer membrane protein TolC
LQRALPLALSRYAAAMPLLILFVGVDMFMVSNKISQCMACVTLAVALSSTHLNQAHAQGLSLEAAQRLALARSRALAAQDQAVSAAQEMAVAAKQLPDPVLRGGIDNLPLSGPDTGSLTRDFMTMLRIGVMQEITRSDKRQLRAERFERAADKSRAEKAATSADIERDTAIAWLERYYVEQMAALVQELAAQARLEIDATEAAYRSGRGNQADLFAAKSALAMIDDRAAEFQNKIQRAKTMLTRWVGAAAEQALTGPTDSASVRLDVGALDPQLSHHPKIAVLTRQANVAETEARLAAANKRADWSVELAFQQRGPGFSNMVSLGFSIPLQWDQKNRQGRELAAKLAMAEQARAERDDMLQNHVAETRAMLDEWQNNRQRSGRYDNELLPLAQQRSTAILAAYRGGKASLLDLLAVKRSEIDLRLQALQLQAETARLWAQINFVFPLSATPFNKATQ